MFQLLLKVISFSKNFRQLGEKVEHFDETDQTRTSGFTIMLLLKILLPLLVAFSIPSLKENKALYLCGKPSSYKTFLLKTLFEQWVGLHHVDTLSR